MVLVKIYSVLDAVAVEITCWHGSDGASHLLMREFLRGPKVEGLGSVLAAASEVLAFASHVTCEGRAYVDTRCEQVL